MDTKANDQTSELPRIFDEGYDLLDESRSSLGYYYKALIINTFKSNLPLLK